MFKKLIQKIFKKKHKIKFELTFHDNNFEVYKHLSEWKNLIDKEKQKNEQD